MSTAKRIVKALNEVKSSNTEVLFPIVGTVVYSSKSRFDKDRVKFGMAGFVAAHYIRDGAFIIVAEMHDVAQLRFFAARFFENIFAKAYEKAEKEDVQIRRNFIDWVTRRPVPRPNMIRAEAQIVEQKRVLNSLGVLI